MNEIMMRIGLYLVMFWWEFENSSFLCYRDHATGHPLLRRKPYSAVGSTKRIRTLNQEKSHEAG